MYLRKRRGMCARHEKIIGARSVMALVWYVGLVLIVLLDHCRGEANLHGCDSTGFCPCTSNNASECSECFECYKDVRKGLQDEMIRFYELKDAVDAFEGRLPNGTFESELKRVQDKLDWLDMDVDSANALSANLKNRLTDVKTTLDEVQAKLNQIRTYLGMANESAQHAATKAQMIDDLVAEAKMKLQEAYDKLTMARNRLADAETARDAIKGLAANISNVATAAEAEAMRQENVATQINDTATMAYENAMEAKRKAEMALNRARYDEMRLSELMTAIGDRRTNLANVRVDVVAAEVAASAAYDKADALYDRAALARPDSGLSAAIRRLHAAQMDTSELTKMLMDLNDRFAGVVTDIDEAMTEADAKSADVDVAMERSQVVKARAMNASEKAQRALTDANQVIVDAERMLNVLVNFSRIINESQASATEALGKIGMIEELVNETIANASRILEDHQQALMDVKMALNVSCKAVDVAQMALEEIRNCTAELEELKATVMNLVTDAQNEKQMAMQLNATAQVLKDECPEFQKNASMKADQVDQAIEEQKNCTDRIEITRGRIDDLTQRITNLRRLDPVEVAQLESDLLAFQARFNDLDVANMIQMLQTQRDELDVELQENNLMIEEMDKDLKSLELIVGAGSQGCVFVGA